MMQDKLQEEIIKLEKALEHLKATHQEAIERIEERILKLKDLVWDRQSKKESSQMYKVLKEDKDSTQVQSEVGKIKVDKDFMEKEIRKHLDNPNLRAMVTTKEMLSFPKVAKGVGAKYNAEHKDFTWKVMANDGNTLIYGSREYKQNNKDINRLLTSHSQTEKGERINNSGNGQTKSTLPPLFKDSDFRRPTVDKTIPNPSLESQIQSLEEQKTLINEMLKTQDELKAMPKAKDFAKDFEKDLEEAFCLDKKDNKENSNSKNIENNPSEEKPHTKIKLNQRRL